MPLLETAAGFMAAGFASSGPTSGSVPDQIISGDLQLGQKPTFDSELPWSLDELRFSVCPILEKDQRDQDWPDKNPGGLDLEEGKSRRGWRDGRERGNGCRTEHAVMRKQ